MEKEHPAPKARRKGLIVHPLPDEILVYDLGRHKALCLNKTSAIVWSRCDGKTTIAELVEHLRNEYETPVDEDVVSLALDQLRKSHLLAGPTAGQKPVLTRRELIKRIGVGGAMSMPLITAVMAPTAAQAATVCSSVVCSGGVCPTGCVCVSNGSPCV
jgi:hypothetical protein